MIDFSVITGLTIPEGEVKQILDASGIALWEVKEQPNEWPEDLDTGLEFVSSNPFTVNVTTPRWDGTMEYCNSDEGWKAWDGSEISSGDNGGTQYIYIRGTGNTTVTSGSNYRWSLNGSDIQCNGNIENLLDYTIVKAGQHPTMGMYCYRSMFEGCTNLTTAPSLPATTLADYCYSNMFKGCTNLTTAPSLPATTLTKYCYSNMFNGCTKIKLSATETDTYTIPYRIPTTGTGTTITGDTAGMFTSTGGTFTGVPTINTTYYLDSSNSIV